LDNALGYTKGIIVCVSNNKATIYSRNISGFWYLNSFKIDLHSKNDILKESILINMRRSATGLYYFESLRDFAEAVLENNWTF